MIAALDYEDLLVPTNAITASPCRIINLFLLLYYLLLNCFLLFIVFILRLVIGVILILKRITVSVLHLFLIL
jgi:hypothetical protein